jgi:hypothetical protein
MKGRDRTQERGQRKRKEKGSGWDETRETGGGKKGGGRAKGKGTEEEGDVAPISQNKSRSLCTHTHTQVVFMAVTLVIC